QTNPISTNTTDPNPTNLKNSKNLNPNPTNKLNSSSQPDLTNQVNLNPINFDSNLANISNSSTRPDLTNQLNINILNQMKRKNLTKPYFNPNSYSMPSLINPTNINSSMKLMNRTNLNPESLYLNPIKPANVFLNPIKPILTIVDVRHVMRYYFGRRRQFGKKQNDVPDLIIMTKCPLCANITDSRFVR
ncbi:27035_t:CDS:2, partial [Dentiscutata erythropus]